MEIKMPFEQWYELHKIINRRVADASNDLREWDYLKSENGLIPDLVRNSVGYQNAKKAYEHEFQKLRNFNARSPKVYMRKASELNRERP